MTPSHDDCVHSVPSHTHLRSVRIWTVRRARAARCPAPRMRRAPDVRPQRARPRGTGRHRRWGCRSFIVSALIACGAGDRRPGRFRRGGGRPPTLPPPKKVLGAKGVRFGCALVGLGLWVPKSGKRESPVDPRGLNGCQIGPTPFASSDVDEKWCAQPVTRWSVWPLRRHFGGRPLKDSLRWRVCVRQAYGALTSTSTRPTSRSVAHFRM